MEKIKNIDDLLNFDLNEEEDFKDLSKAIEDKINEKMDSYFEGMLESMKKEIDLVNSMKSSIQKSIKESEIKNQKVENEIKLKGDSIINTIGNLKEKMNNKKLLEVIFSNGIKKVNLSECNEIKINNIKLKNIGTEFINCKNLYWSIIKEETSQGIYIHYNPKFNNEFGTPKFFDSDNIPIEGVNGKIIKIGEVLTLENPLILKIENPKPKFYNISLKIKQGETTLSDKSLYLYLKVSNKKI